MALEAVTIDDEIASDWKAIQEKYAVEPEAPPAEAPAPEQTETPETQPERARDESGKFVKGAPAPAARDAKADDQSVAKTAVKPAAAAPAPSESPVPATAAVPEGRDTSRPPSTWKPTARADWDKIPPAVRAEIHRREQDFLDGHKQIRPDADFGKQVREVVAPYRMLIEAEGGTPERAIGDLLRTAATLRVGTPQEKVNTIARIASQYGVDLRAFQAVIGQPDPAKQGQQPANDPRVDAILQHLNQQQQATAQREQADRESAATSWMHQVDESGQPLHPYLGDVINQMSPWVAQIRDENPGLAHHEVLQQAYDKAVWANPEIRQLLITQQAQKTEQTRASDNQNRVREARRAASVNVPRRASLPSPGKPGRMEDTIETTARELGLIT